MNHFLQIQHLSNKDIENLLQKAFLFKRSGCYPDYNRCTVATLFYENSTRTRISFQLAATRLNMPVIHLDLQMSSERKGESIQDTLHTLYAMGISTFVIRHYQDGLPDALAAHCHPGIHIINAGDGQHAHPSQAMLDLMTIIEKKPDLESLKIAIVGDIKHSRVANSLQCLLAKLGVGALTLIAPGAWQSENVHFGEQTTSLSAGIKDADVIICLRIQSERLSQEEIIDKKTYCEAYAITQQNLQLAKPDVMIMHPGPVNRDIEIESGIVDGTQSAILQQVHNGVFMRMAIFEAIVESVDN